VVETRPAEARFEKPDDLELHARCFRQLSLRPLE
jgi:hypothetical protein